MNIKFPLFVRAKDSGEVAKFDSIHELQAHVEKIDVENSEYEAWDKDGLIVKLMLCEPALWIKLEPASDDHSPDDLRRALISFGKSAGVELPENLPVCTFETALEQVRSEQEKKMLAGSAVRRFFARFRQLRGNER